VLVSMLVLLEPEWVLRNRYGFNREALLSIFRALLESRELLFEDEPALEEALFRWKDSARFFGLPHYSSQSADGMPRDGYLRRQSRSATRHP
jgi:hypothetical protein